MWRRLSVTRTPAVRRRLCLPRRSFCSPTTAALQGALRPSPHAQDDFFVDIDSLAGYSESAEAMGSSNPQQRAASHAQPSSDSSEHRSGPASDVLGVIRSVPEEEGARYSRLQIPLVDSDEASAMSPRLRSNTRAGLGLGEEAAYADFSAGPIETQESTQHTTADGSRNGGAALEVAVQDAEADADGGGRLPDPTHLPYDDERFAEMLLEMEVNGVIDETWQNANKAHVEDVKEIADILASLKVRDICCIDVSEKTSNFDYMMFGTCEGARHIHLAAWAAQDADKVHRISKIKRKQMDELWEVVPIGRIVLNLMVESFREEMSLERKWAVTRSMDPLAAANAPISEGRQVKAHGLWTLTLNLQDLEDFEVDYCKDILMRQM
ncbi:Ribosomal silencing factor during starvation [Lotmaria passim]